MNFAGPSEARHVHNQSDIRKLPKACGNAKLVLVHAEKLRTAASWAVEMASLADMEANSRPAIFSVSNPGNGEDDPGVAMVIRANPAELTSVARWFALGQIPTVPNWAAIAEDVATTPVAALAPILLPRPGEESSARRLREQDILRNLVVGAAVLRLVGQGAEQTAAVEELTLTTDDYEQVRLLLQSPLVAPADEVCDPLAKDMVNRANVFLQAKLRRAQCAGQSVQCGWRRFAAGRRDQPRPRHATGGRRLGQRPFAADSPTGGVCAPPQRRLRTIPADWPDAAAAAAGSLAACGSRVVGGPLASNWTTKQVRTHFDQLRRSGMITAERAAANVPWRYALPEKLQGRHDAYRRLPTAAELIARQTPE